MATLVVGVKGLVLTLDPQVSVSGNIPTLTGTTVTLTIRQPDGQTDITRTATVSSDGKTAQYLTDGTEFPVPGRYTFQLVVTSSGTVLPSPWLMLEVVARL